MKSNHKTISPGRKEKASSGKTVPQRQPTYEELEQRIKALEAVNENYAIAFENTGTAILIVEDDTTISLVNSEFEDLSGITKEEIEGRMSLPEFFTEKEKTKVIEYHVLRRMDMPLVPRAYETEFVDNMGNTRPVYMAVSIIPGTKKSVASILDLSDIKQAQSALSKQQAYFRQLFKNSPQAIMIVDAMGKIIDVNESFQTLFGYVADEITGQQGQDIVVPKDRITESETLYRSALRGEPIRNETLGQHKNGKLIPISVIGYPIEINEQIEGYFYIYDDISERKEFETQLHHQAFYDSLTGLPNRILFMERLGHSVEMAKRHADYSFAVLLVDLDRFKNVNDSLGHLAGDNLLIEIANRFHSCVRSSDTVARMGGDEFAVLTEEYHNPQEVIQIAKRIQNAAELPFYYDDNETHISASIGIVEDTRLYENAESILRDADIAMYRAKSQGRSCFKMFNKKMHELLLESQKIETDLRIALKENQLRVHYQPIVSVATNKLKGFEALVRWEHPSQGMIYPKKFIPIAEETGLINALGKFVIIEACRQMKEWQKLIPEARHLTMNVNVSVKQFMQKGLISFIVDALKENDLDPGCLKVEITESVLMESSKTVVEKFKRLRDIGIKLVIDDFGTGYSSLSYLQQFPIDHLKIDRSFISEMGAEKESMEIVKTIIDLARNLGLTVVAEGVETAAQFEILKTISCDSVQGFLFSKPVDNSGAMKIIKKLL